MEGGPTELHTSHPTFKDTQNTHALVTIKTEKMGTALVVL